MRSHRVLMAALLFAVAAPIAAHAQDTVVFRTMTRGMLGIMTESMPADDVNARERLIVDVVSGSPAEQAGLLRGDIIVTVDGEPATRIRMNSGFEVGDTIMLRVRRDGRERQVQVVAGERVGGYSIYEPVLSDSVRQRVSIIMNDVRAHADTMAVHLRRFAGDSATWIFSRDSVNVFRFSRQDSTVFLRALEFDRAHIDSVRAHVFHASRDLPRFLADSARFRMEQFPDSAFFRVAPGEGAGGRYRVWSVGPDSLRALRPADMWATSVSFGARAVAGAELTELNQGLADYFGTDSGVLVLNAAEGTPAADAGIRSGDVIVRANGIDVNSILELRRAVEAAARGSDIELRVLRRGQNVDVRLRRE